MSWLSQGLKKVGGVAKKIAPVVGLIPGVGTVAGAAIGGLGSLASGDSLGEALKSAAIGGLSGYGGSTLLGGKGILGIGSGLKKVGGALGIGGGSSIGGSGALSGLPMPDIGKAPGSGGILGSLGGILGGGLKKIGGVDGLLGAGALGYGAYQQKQAGDMREKALKLLSDDYASRAPLRKAGLSGMLNETPPDLSATFSPAMQNPFARRVA